MRERIQNTSISKYEEPLLRNIAARVSPFLHPDVATLVAVLSSIMAFYAYTRAPSNPVFYLVASLCIGSHYIFDGIDGKIAKLRGMDTPGHPFYRGYGWHIDKTADFIATVFFVSGAFWAITQNLALVALHLGMYVIFYVWLMRYCAKRKKDVVLGGTESRLVLIGLNIFFFSLLTL